MPAARSTALSGGTGQGGSATGTASGRRRQLSTPTRLRRLLAAVLTATGLFWIAATILQQGVEAAAHSSRDALSPAYQDEAQARALLSDADLAAWQAFRSGTAQLTGPGLQYQDADSSLLQTVSGQLVSYQSLVEQADAEYRRDIALGTGSRGALGFAYLTYSSNTLHDPQGGLLASIDELLGPGQQTLRGQLASPWANRVLPLAVAVPALLALSGVVAAQMFLRHRFKRAVNPPLLLAAAVICVLAGWLVIATWHADLAFGAARETALSDLAEVWQSQMTTVDMEAKALRANGASGGSDVSSGGLNPSATQRATSALDADLTSAENAGGLPAAIPALAAAAAVLSYAGFRPRLNEYRAIPAGAGIRARVGRAESIVSPAGGGQR